MNLNEIFAKDVQRPIEGVIKADDASQLGTEVDEYVLTNEAASGLEHLLEEYTRYTNANGVWISGFFGSGKSHLLKMLAHLLGDVEGQDFPRERVSESFRDKASDAFLPGLLDKAGRIPAKSLLFNIDQKATLIAKDQRDALLKVFVKVFDESRGYYGNQGHIARFERDLDNRGQYEAFKAAYRRVSGRDWAQGREEGVLEEPNVALAYAEVSGQADGAPAGILTKYRAEYKVSIEDFADEVKVWLDKQDKDFRLNFFVDEVGQFIGSNTDLMLNLQTIAESLNTKCHGRAWVFVTSQEDMDKVVGDRTKQQGNDFSKIQARFATRVKLTSADVDEVIRKRLLEKNRAGEEALRAIHAEQSANFKTLFDFVDGSKTYRIYPDEDAFTGTYPFVSYQFPLFQAAIEGISDRNVFEGRNSSVGERSMLGVVQQVAKDISEKEVGTLATFDSMFAGIRASLKSAAQRAIDVAERNLDDELAVRLLKALFLVKYVESFHATARNLTVLVYDRFGLDLPDLSQRVKDALSVLETQSYVQRKSDNVYEYLTDDEKRIEEEIKNVDIDSSETSRRLFEVLSGEVIRTSKLRYAKNGQDFPFSYRLDDQVYGKQHDLSVHFITPAYEFDAGQIRMHGMGRDELRVILAPDERVMSDLRLLIKTEKYIKRKQSTSLTPIEERILSSKAAQSVERRKALVERVRRSVGKAELVVNATDVHSGSAEALQRVTDGFQELVSRTYTLLKLLGDTTYPEKTLGVLANPAQDGLVGVEGLSKLDEPAEEVLSLVRQRQQSGGQTNVKSLVDAFWAKPYGWDLGSVEVVIGWLFHSAKVTLTVDGNAVKRTELAAMLRNTQKHPHLVVGVQKSFDARKVADFRTFCVDFFDEPNPPKDPVELAAHGGDRLRGKLDELRALASGSNYPFIAQLDEPIALLEQVVGKPDEWYFTDFDLSGDLLDVKDNLLDPIRAFLGGGQKAIFDDAKALLAVNANNLGYLPAGSDAEVNRFLEDPNAFRGNKMTLLKQVSEALNVLIQEALGASRAEAVEAIEGRKGELLGNASYSNATEDARQAVVGTIDGIIDRIHNERQIAHVRELGSAFAETVYPGLLDKLDSSVPRSDAEGEAAPAPRVTISVNKIAVPGTHGRVLATSEDVDEYIEELRGALLGTINDGKRIAL